jgi:hypothetical protein
MNTHWMAYDADDQGSSHESREDAVTYLANKYNMSDGQKAELGKDLVTRVKKGRRSVLIAVESCDCTDGEHGEDE